MYGVAASLLMIIGCVLAGSSASAATNTLHLSIKPIFCVVDVVQDGTRQSVSTPSPDCAAVISQSRDAAVASLLFDTRLTSQKEQGLIILRQIDSPWSPIPPQGHMADAGGQPHPVTLVIAITVTTLTITLGADAAFFRLRYAKRTVGWLHARTIARLIK